MIGSILAKLRGLNKKNRTYTKYFRTVCGRGLTLEKLKGLFFKSGVTVLVDQSSQLLRAYKMEIRRSWYSVGHEQRRATAAAEHG